MKRKTKKLPTFWVVYRGEHPIISTVSFSRADAKCKAVVGFRRQSEHIESNYPVDSKSLYRVQDLVWQRLAKEQKFHAVKVHITAA